MRAEYTIAILLVVWVIVFVLFELAVHGAGMRDW